MDVQVLLQVKTEAKLYFFDKITIRLIYHLTTAVKYVVIILGQILGQCWTSRFGNV